VLAVDEGDLDVTLIDEREVLAVDEAQGRVRLVRKRSYSSITLSEVVVGEADPRAAKPLLAPLFLANPRRWLGKQATLDEVMSRVAWLQGRGATEVPDVSLEALAPWLLDFVDAKQGLKSLGSIDVGAALLAARADLRARLERDAPSSVRLPNGRVAAIDYAREVGPTVSARVQELFGSRGLPALLGGRQPLVIELLGPNYRPVQITSDLEGFWLRTYKSVRAELRRRYPKHAWPEDPPTATPETRPRR
nr:ATP-dependent helicase C-terminal domain-containing protein [Planctomycetota bacterium]